MNSKTKTKPIANNIPEPIVPTIPKSVKELRTFLETKMEQYPTTGSWINPFRDDAYNKDITPILHHYRSHAVDEAMKFFLSKYLGEERRIQLLGKEWSVIV